MKKIVKIRKLFPFLGSITLLLLLAGIYLLNDPEGGGYAMSGVPLDDTWIHLVYARSLAEQGWFYYNTGVAEAGMSSPLWTIVLSVGYKLLVPLGMTPVWVAKSASMVFALGLPVVTIMIVNRLVDNQMWSSLAAFFVVADPNLLYCAISGMEVTLAALLLELAILFSIERRYLWTGLTLGALVVTRAECVPIALLIGGIPIFQVYLKREADEPVLITRKELKLAMQLFLPAFATGILWVTYNFSVNGQIFPNTYYVKHGFDLGFFNFPNLMALVTGYLAHLSLFKGLISPWMLLSIFMVIRRFSTDKAYELIAFFVGIPLITLYLFSINLHLDPHGPWIFYARRYMDFIVPFWAMLLAMGMAFAWEHALTLPNRSWSKVAPLVVIAVIGMYLYSSSGLHLTYRSEFYEDVRRVETVDREMGLWAADHLPPTSTIGITEAGAFKFFSYPDQVVIDFLGLNNAFCVGQPPAYIIESLEPDYLIFFRPAIPDGIPYTEIFSMDSYPDDRGAEYVVLRSNDLSE